MNATANAFGLGAVLATAVGLSVLFVAACAPSLVGAAVGAATAGLYIVGWYVGQADARRQGKAGQR